MSETPWLLLLYSLPAKKGSARVNIWRKVRKTGALPFKSSSYLLPNQPELLERFHWLAQQIQEMGGDATVAQVAALEGLSPDHVAVLFNDARGAEYGELIAGLKEWNVRLRKTQEDGKQAALEKLRRRYLEIRGIDYFNCPQAEVAARLLERASAPFLNRSAQGATRAGPILSPRQYTGKTWLTRPHPAIDRVGSAWLIFQRIDPKARFVFGNSPKVHPDAIPYDMPGVEFTHQGEDCTFETLLRRFGLQDPVLARIGEMIHDADLDDGKFQTVEAFGLDRVFKGWARLNVPDEEILHRGFPCFDALYSYFKAKP